MFVVAAGVALTFGIATGTSRRAAEPASVQEQAAASDAAWSAAAALKHMAERDLPRRGGPDYYRRTARKHVTPKAVARFLPLYREAERVYEVSWRLIASIHRQETAFSTAPSTYHGLNPFGCCAGPMQFNVTNGPPSTWKLYRKAFRDGRRPRQYPHRTRAHPSIYDDFDAVMAAGSLLSDLGAGRALDGDAWSAAYGYYGHDLFGVTYASQVLARAEAWRRDGFCPNCALDERLVKRFDDAYGEPVRRQLLADDAREKKRKKGKHRRKKKKDRHGRRRRAHDDSRDRDRRRSRARARRPSNPPAAKKERSTRPTAPTAPAPTQPSTQPPRTAPPPGDDCSDLRKLLDCVTPGDQP